jgi:hypothetical protein
VAFNVTRDTNNNQIIVQQENGGEGVRIEYNARPDSFMFIDLRDDELGFKFLGLNGAPLNATEEKAAIALFEEALNAKPTDIKNKFAETLEERLLNTDNDSTNRINRGDIDNLYGALSPKTLLGAIAISGLYQAMDTLSTKKPDQDVAILSAITEGEFQDDHETQNSTEIMKLLRAAKINESAIEAITPKFKPTDADADKQTKIDADKVKADAAKKEEDAKTTEKEAAAKKALKEAAEKEAAENKGKLTSHHTIERVQKALGIRNVNGVRNNGTLDTGTEKLVQDHVEGVLKSVIDGTHPIQLKDGANGKLINLFNPATNKNELYELAATNENGPNGNVTAYYAHAIDGEGKRIKDGSTKIDVSEKIPALTALFSLIRADLDQKILATETHFREEEQDRITKIKDEQRAKTDAFLKLIGREDLKADVTKDIINRRFDGDALRKKLNVGTKHEEALGAYIAAMDSLHSQRVSFSENLVNMNADYETADSVYKMLNFMSTGKEYDPTHDQNLRDGTAFRDNILAPEAYDIVSSMAFGEKIHISMLIDEENPEQEARVLAAFKDQINDGNLEITREDVYDFVKQEHDNYALRVLTGKDDISDMTETERTDMLKNVTAAMTGRYKNEDGTPVIFRPFLEDYKLARKSFDRPELGDPILQSRIDLIRNNGTRIPDGKDATYTLNTGEQKALFDAGKALIGAEDKVFEDLRSEEKTALLGEIVSEMRPELYKDPNYAKVVQNYYEKHLIDYYVGRAGTPDRDENGRVTFNKDGFSTWTGGTEGAYGGLHIDDFVKTYVHYNRFELEDPIKLYGEKGAAIFFHGHYSDRNRNDGVTYDQVKEHLLKQEKGEALFKKFDERVRDQDVATAFNLYRVREDLYNRAEFANQQKNHMLEIVREAEPESDVTTDDENENENENENEQNISENPDFALDIKEQESNTSSIKNFGLLVDPAIKTTQKVKTATDTVRTAISSTLDERATARANAAIDAALEKRMDLSQIQDPDLKPTTIMDARTPRTPMHTDYLFTSNPPRLTPQESWLNTLVRDSVSPTAYGQIGNVDYLYGVKSGNELATRASTEIAEQTIFALNEGSTSTALSTNVMNRTVVEPINLDPSQWISHGFDAPSTPSNYVLALPDNRAAQATGNATTWADSLILNGHAANHTPLLENLEAKPTTTYEFNDVSYSRTENVETANNADWNASSQTKPDQTSVEFDTSGNSSSTRTYVEPTLSDNATRQPTANGPYTANNGWTGEFNNNSRTNTPNTTYSNFDEAFSVKTPGKWSLFKATASDVTSRSLKTLAKGIKTVPVVGSFFGGVIGSTIASIEANAIEKKLPAIKDAGLVKEDAQRLFTTQIASQLSGYVASGADPSIVGGELYLKSKQGEIIAQYKLDPITQHMILPDLFIDLLTTNSAETDLINYRETKKQWTDENVTDMHNSITNKYFKDLSDDQLKQYGLLRDTEKNTILMTATVNKQQIQGPLGILLRKESVAKDFLSRIQTGTKQEHFYNGSATPGTKHVPTYETDMKAAYDSLTQINEMHGHAMHELETTDPSFVMKNDNGDTFVLAYLSREHWFGDAYDENGFSAYIDTQSGRESFTDASTGDSDFAMTDNTKRTELETNFHQSLIGQKEEVVAYMKAMLNERINMTDGNNKNIITLEDLEKVRDSIVKRGKVASIVDAYAVEALYQAASELDATQITTANKNNFMKYQAGDQKTATETIERTKQEKPEYFKTQTAKTTSPFNDEFNTAQKAQELDQTQNNTLTVAFGEAMNAQVTQAGANFLNTDNYMKEMNDLLFPEGSKTGNEAPKANYVERLPDTMS